LSLNTAGKRMRVNRAAEAKGRGTTGLTWTNTIARGIVVAIAYFSSKQRSSTFSCTPRRILVRMRVLTSNLP
jgi:hypothetical protein